MVQSGNSQLVVSACGRTVSLDLQSARTLLGLQNSLQEKLGMEGQTFHFFDVNGTTLSTDGELHSAISQGQVPLCATLTDASIHFIENRREELAQMQWKLVRDQMTGATGKIAALARQVNETTCQLDSYKNESNALIDRLHKEALRAVASERDVAQTELQQLSERVSAVAQLVNSERQKREIAHQGIEKQLSSIRDLLDSERSTRRQDLAMHMSIVQDAKAQLEGERTAREALEDKHTFDIHTLSEKAETFQRHVSDLIQDQNLETAKTVAGVQDKFQDHVRQVGRVRQDVENSAQEMQVRFVQFEERCAALENRLADVTSRQTASLDRLVERHERVAQVVEGLRLDERSSQSQVQAALTRMMDLETSIAATEGQTRDLVFAERQGRDDQLRRAQVALHSEQRRQMCELEEKMTDRLAHESSEREKNVQAIFEEVGKNVPKVVRRVSGGSPTRMTPHKIASEMEIYTPSVRPPTVSAVPTVPAMPLVATGSSAVVRVASPVHVEANNSGSFSVPAGSFSVPISVVSPQQQPMSPGPQQMRTRAPEVNVSISATMPSRMTMPASVPTAGGNSRSSSSARGPSVSITSAPSARTGAIRQTSR